MADAIPTVPESMAAKGLAYARHEYGALETVTDGTAWAAGKTIVKGPWTHPETGVTYPDQELGYIPLVERWDGSGWSVTPVDGADQAGEFRDVDAVAPDDAWAVGRGEPNRPLLAHWDGASWKRYASPTAVVVDSSFGPAESWSTTALDENFELTGVDMVTSDDGWAVGTGAFMPDRPRILHWDGLAWRSDALGEIAALNNPLLLQARPVDVAAVAGPNGTQVFVAGSRYDERLGKVRTFVLRYDGERWARMATPDAPDGRASTLSGLSRITATSPSDVWAVGTWAETTSASQPLVLHYDGVAWTATTIMAKGYGGFGSVDASPSSAGTPTVWVGGFQEPGSRGPFGLFARLADNGWKTTTPADSIDALAVASPTSGWAVLGERFRFQSHIYRVSTCR